MRTAAGGFTHLTSKAIYETIVRMVENLIYKGYSARQLAKELYIDAQVGMAANKEEANQREAAWFSEFAARLQKDPALLSEVIEVFLAPKKSKP